MKKFLLTILLLLAFYISNSQIIDNGLIEKAAVNKIKVLTNDVYSIVSINEIKGKNDSTLLYNIKLSPNGYIVMQNNFLLEPVIAYSLTDSIDDVFLYFLTIDAQARHDKLEMYLKLKNNKNIDEWKYLIMRTTENFDILEFEQWPSQGTTLTGGWLNENWHQSAPYNNMCPFDNVANTRSYAGCPAVAAAMIIDHNKKINETTFSDLDDYHHNYGGNNYYIDDDYIAFKFPDFDSLNQYLTDIQNDYDNDKKLSDAEKSALVFACGTVANQVYNSQGSGTFGVSQANDLYEKFGFEKAQLYTELTTPVYEKLVNNMKSGFPAHLAVVNQEWTVGHNVVVDGYNTDDFFHINFGWGGSSNGWWNVPDSNFPYSMSVLEGIILDINYEEPVVNLSNSEYDIEIYPNPGNGVIFIQNNEIQEFNSINVYTIDGKLIYSERENYAKIDLSKQNSGIYIIKLHFDNFVITEKYLLL